MNTSINKLFSLKNTFLLFVTVLSISLSSCGKKNDTPVTPPAQKGKTAKFTFTVNGVAADGYVSFITAGVAVDLNTSTIWKVNGVTQNNEAGISLGASKFAGSTKTYVVESTTPLQAISVGIQCLAPDNKPYKISYKAEIDGVVKENDENITVTKAEDFTHDFTY